MLDEIDIQILDILKNDSKKRINEISKKIGIPPSTVHLRIKKLENKKIIKNYSIIIDYKKIGFDIHAYVLIYVDVQMLKKLKKDQEDLITKLKKISEVKNANILAGECDIICNVYAKDIDHLQKIVLKKIQSIDSIIKTKTLISMN